MHRGRRIGWWGGAAVGPTLAAVAVALAVRWALDPFLGDHLPYPTFLAAAAVAAGLGGLRAGMLAVTLGLLLSLYCFVPPRGTVFDKGGLHLIGLVVYLLVGTTVAVLGEAMRAGYRRAAEQAERLRTTLASIGDAVITTDAAGRVTDLNPVAEGLTGWPAAEARGRPLTDVFRIVNETTRAPVENPALRALGHGTVVGLANHTLLLSRDGTERPIDDSAAPIRDAGGVTGSVLVFRDVTAQRGAERELREQRGTAETLLRVGNLIAQEHDLHRLVQVVTDEGTRLCGAQFGAFFYNVVGARGEAYTLYTLSGVPAEAFAQFPMPRNTALFGPTFRGECVVRLDDVTQDPRYGKSGPHHGMPEGHLPVRSYLAVPVVSRTGEVLGGLFFGHAEPGRFSAHHERLLTGIAGQAAVAVDNARLYQRTQGAAERLNLALSAADLGDWSWDAASDVVTFSQRAADVFGIQPGPHMTWTEMQGLLHPDDRERARREVGRVVAERAQYDIEYRVVRRDGSQMWVGVLGRAAYDAAGRVTGMFGVVKDVSDRKQLEESLRRSEGRFRGLMEQAPFSVQVFSADGRTVRVNRAWEELWGLTLDKLTDYNVLEDPQLEAKGVLPYIRRAFAGEPTFVPAIQYDPNETIPDRTRHADPVRWVAAVAYPLKDDAGAVREVVLVHEDTTARRRAEAALRDTEQRFRQLADAMPQIVWTAGPDGGIDYLNHRWAEFTGQPETVSNEGWGPLLHPEEAAAARERWAASVRSGEPFEMELRLLDHARGTHRWHLIRTVAVRDAAGAVARWYGTATDIHEQKRAEETARYLAAASAALAGVVDYERTLEKVADLAVPYFADWAAVDVADEGGALRRLAVAHKEREKIELVHQLMREYPPDPAAPTGAYAVHRSGKPEFVPEISDEMRGRSARDEKHLRLIRSLGLKSYICVPLVDSGTPLGVLTFATAESGRTYTEADLALATDLAHRAAVAVDNARLYQQVRTADRRKDEFLATLAHELRNPLAPVRTGVQILKMARDPDRDARTLAMMERQVAHLVRLVDDLMDVSRITRGKLELRRERTDLRAVADAAVEASRPVVEQAGHTLAVAVPAGPVFVDGDPTRLAQVVSNLLSNSAKYTRPGGHVRLTVSRDGDRAVVSVADDGIGIPAGMLERVFDMFTQVDRALEKTTGGLGIGLSLVKGLVEMHGGTVEARSEGEGRGSEFVVRLPAAAGDRSPAPAAGDNGLAPTGRRVLVVDDNVDAAESLAQLLQVLGLEARTAYDGEAGVTAAGEFRPDVVLLDIGMPRLNGYDAARRIRAQPWGRSVVLVALTGWGQENDRRRTAEAGFDHHLVKPVDLARLTALLSESSNGTSAAHTV